MRIDEEKLQEVLAELTLSREQLLVIANDFCQEMKLGLEKSGISSMKMLCSYIGMPSGNEKGDFLALDFGGTNLRAELVSLKGNGSHEVVKKITKPLITTEYNYINGSASAEQVFDFIADMFVEVLADQEKKQYFLGHTFSFPSAQTDIYNARLITWTKEFAVPGVEGEVVNDLLAAALKRKGLDNVQVVAVINDTVAELLAAGYQYPDTEIGCIYATGNNNCYIEHTSTADRPEAIINMESGAFDKIEQSSWDARLDKDSEKPGEQRFEKMISGRYMGELLSLIIKELLGLKYNPGFNAVDMSGILEDTSVDAVEAARVIRAKTGELEPGEAVLIRRITEAVAKRSARLVATSFAGILQHTRGDGPIKPQHIAVDGSVFAHMPQVQENVCECLEELLGAEAKDVKPILLKDGSCFGAAIAAAVASKIS